MVAKGKEKIRARMIFLAQVIHRSDGESHDSQRRGNGFRNVYDSPMSCGTAWHPSRGSRRAPVRADIASASRITLPREGL